MPRKLIIALTLVLATSLAAKAQTSVQLFYDFGKHLYHKSGPQGNNLSSRYYLTSTVEHFSADRWGSTFLFTDVYYGNTARLGAAGGKIYFSTFAAEYPCNSLSGIIQYFRHRGGWYLSGNQRAGCFRNGKLPAGDGGLAVGTPRI